VCSCSYFLKFKKLSRLKHTCESNKNNFIFNFFFQIMSWSRRRRRRSNKDFFIFIFIFILSSTTTTTSASTSKSPSTTTPIASNLLSTKQRFMSPVEGRIIKISSSVGRNVKLLYKSNHEAQTANFSDNQP
jgi:hypothetical protein